jgi:hypothetical protein
MNRLALALLVAAATGACAAAPAIDPYAEPYGLYMDRSARQQEEEPQSLFPSDLAVLSDSAIRRILGYRLTLEATNKVAVMQLGGRWGYLWWEDAVARMNEFVTGQLVQILVASPRVREAAVLPTLMVPKERAVPYLREAAARFQADLLFIFRPDCQTFRRSRFLAADEVRAACTVESILLDIRTGIVPFSQVATREYVARKTGDDANFQETIVRAELQAITEGLEDVANSLVAFLRSVPLTER